MINYSYKTVKQVIDEVILRIGKHRVQENIGWSDLVYDLNRAMREIMVESLPFKDWAYLYRMDVANGAVLPREYIKYVRVLVSESGQPPYHEARYCDPREWHSMTDWQSFNLWNKGTAEAPIFTIWGKSLVPTIFIYPNTDYQSGTAPEGYTYPTSNMSGVMEYYRVFDDLVNETDVVMIPYEYDEALILGIMSRVFAKSGFMTETLVSYQGMVNARGRAISINLKKEYTEKREIDSFVEPVVPYIQKPPLAGEFNPVQRRRK